MTEQSGGTVQQPRRRLTYDELRAMLPDAAIEPSNSGELIIYTGLRIDERDHDGPLISFECPTCTCEYQADNPTNCDDPWHLNE